MGQSFGFVCKRCDYTTEVTDGPDMGFSVYTDTRVCERCENVVDVITGRVEGTDDRLSKRINKCPKCRRVARNPWLNHACPKCGDTMVKSGSFMSWD